MHLLAKLTSEICPKIGGLGGKTEQNRLKVTILSSLIRKTPIFVEKRKTLVDFIH